MESVAPRGTPDPFKPPLPPIIDSDIQSIDPSLLNDPDSDSLENTAITVAATQDKVTDWTRVETDSIPKASDQKWKIFQAKGTRRWGIARKEPGRVIFCLIIIRIDPETGARASRRENTFNLNYRSTDRRAPSLSEHWTTTRIPSGCSTSSRRGARTVGKIEIC